jgi:cytidine deaminase
MAQLNPITYYDTWSQLEKADIKLLERAKENQAYAYAPYSNFLVGAAIRMADGQILDGFNIENAAYPMCLCAERTVMAHAIANDPNGVIEALAVIGGNLDLPAFPCGACRQVMAEMALRQAMPFKVLVASLSDKVYIVREPNSLLPHAFDSGFLISKA